MFVMLLTVSYLKHCMGYFSCNWLVVYRKFTWSAD